MSAYNKLVNTIINPAVIIDDEFNIVAANNEALDYFNINKSIILSLKITHLVSEKIITIAMEEVDHSREIIRFSMSDYMKNSAEWFMIKNKTQRKVFYILLCEKPLETSLRKTDDTLRVIEEISDFMPGNFYWKNAKGVYLGCNTYLLKTLGFNEKHNIVGKTDYELWPDQADELRRNDLHVMETGELLEREEIALLADGTKSYFAAIKIPMRNALGEIIGIIGNSLDITPQKQAEMLKFENATQKAQLEAQIRFTQIANQVAHDIRSPVAALLMIFKSCKGIPEKERVALREAVTRVQDIANNLLTKYQLKDEKGNFRENITSSHSEEVLVSSALLQLMTEKKFQYEEKPVKFEADFSQQGYFAFINIDPTAFKRMISNLINNSVDAFDTNEGKIWIRLDIVQDCIKITVEDNGKGMPFHVVEKILGNIAVTAGKKNGHGLGLTQVRETLANYKGELEIKSEIGKGTKITLWFPYAQAPEWMAEKMVLNLEDIIVILDDDTSIHTAWDSHFEFILKKEPALCVKHFEQAEEALNFMHSLSAADKQRVFLLTDFELLQQKLNGLDVIEKSGVKRSILVTSHYVNSAVRKQAAKIKTKVLPKQLASEIPISILK